MGRLRDDLERDWEALVARPGSVESFARWAAIDARLAGLRTAGEVLSLVRRPPSAEVANGLLAALLRLGRDDLFARRCLLQALLPGLVNLTGRYPSAGEDADERLQTVLVLAVERIHELAGDEVAWPAVAVGGHVRDRLRRAQRAGWDHWVVPIEAALAVPAGPERSAAERLAGVVVEGFRRGTICRDEAALVYTTRVVGHTPAALAAAAGVDPVVLRARRRRAEHRLAATLSVC
jgi:hypothetical protein